MSAFTIAFQVPNLMRALFADAALQGAFVPVFTELLEKGRKKEAFRVASSLLLPDLAGPRRADARLHARGAADHVARSRPGFHDDPSCGDLTVQPRRG